MPKYFLLFFFYGLVLIQTFAQQQITDFPTETILSPSSFQYCGQVNDKVIFSSYKPEHNSITLWVSDGTKKGTYLLKDQDFPNYSFSNFVPYNNQLYFLVNKDTKREVWKTDGTIENTKKVFESDSIKEINVVQGKLLLILYKYLYYEQLKFAWLNDAGKADIWVENVWFYNIVDDKIHYIDYGTSKYSQLKVYDGKIKTVIGLLKDRAYFSGPIKYQEHFYYYFYNQGEKKVLISDLQNPEKNQLLDWTGHPDSFMIFVNDTAQSLHLLKFMQGQLQIYKVGKNNTLKEIASVSNSSMSSALSNNFGSIQNPVLYNNNLVFTTVSGAEGGTNNFRVHRYNIKENEYKFSDNLKAKFVWDVKITPRNNDVYELDGWNYNCLYDFGTNRLDGCVTSPPANGSSSRVQVQTKTKTYELSDNLYLITQYKKTPLLQTQTIYNPPTTGFYYQDTLNNQLLFWTYNQTKGSNQIWISDGLKTNPIFEYDNPDRYTTSMSIDKRLPHGHVFSTHNTQEISIYKTNGTAEGTKQLVRMECNNYYIINTDHNDKLVVYRIYLQNKSGSGRTEKLVVINIETEEVKIIDISERGQVYVTTTNVYLINYTDDNKCKISVLKDEELKEISGIVNSEGLIGNVFAYEDKLYYLYPIENRYGEIRYLDSSLKIKSLYKDVEYFVIYDKYLLAYTRKEGIIADLSSQSTHTIEKGTNFFLDNISYQYDKLIFSDYNNLYLYDKDFSLQKVSVKDKIQKLQVIKSGVFIISYSYSTMLKSLFFYNFKTQTLKEIVKEEDRIGIELIADDTIVLIRSDPFNRIRAWSVLQERFTTLPDAINCIMHSTKDIIIAEKLDDYSNSYVLVKQDTVFKQKYKFNKQSYTIVGKTDTSICFSYYEFPKGKELLCVTKDSIEYLPEIVKGREGIEQASIFNFKNNMYVVGSTYTYGTQVWRINTSVDEAIPENNLKLESGVEHERINIYPNPTQDILTIEVARPSEIQLLQMDGKAVFQTKTVNLKTELNMADLPQGIYLIRIANEKGVFNKKIVKF